MTTVPLRNIKLESLVKGLFSFGLSSAIFLIAYYATSGGFVYGSVFAFLKKDAYQLLLFVISIIPLIFAIFMFIDYFSIKKLGNQFKLTLERDRIRYPLGTRKGFLINEIKKNQILYAKDFHKGNHQYEIQLKDHNHYIVGVINFTDLFDHKKTPKKELTNQINEWLDNGNLIDLSLL